MAYEVNYNLFLTEKFSNAEELFTWMMANIDSNHCEIWEVKGSSRRWLYKKPHGATNFARNPKANNVARSLQVYIDCMYGSFVDEEVFA